MFTGIVEELGAVLFQDDTKLRIGASTVLSDTKIGDSIAVNGTCLTVTEMGPGWFQVGVVPETLRRTNLGRLHHGDPVNLERSVAANGRIGGHFVQGHVDGTAELVSTTNEGNSVVAKFRVAEPLRRYLVDKGFVAVDGASLTIVESRDDWFTIALIPHTRATTTFGVRSVGDLVNIEVDILGKYVERFVGESGRQR